MMKSKVTGAILVVAGAAIAFASIVAAEGTPLAVTCSGSVASNTITWAASASGGVSPYTYNWIGTNVSGTSTSAMSTYSANGTYQATVQVTDASSSATSANCSAMVTSFPAPTPTPTPPPLPAPHVMKPSLSIGENGQFLARGMTVTSVSSGSFQAQVWGITYTVNWSGNNNYYGPFEFYLRYGNYVVSSTNPGQQLTVGDEVGVSGKITSGTPLVVNANIVRDYSIATPRPIPFPFGQIKKFVEDGGSINVTGGASGTVSTTVGTGDAAGKLKDLLKQLESLQNLFNHGGGNGNGNNSNSSGSQGQGNNGNHGGD